MEIEIGGVLPVGRQRFDATVSIDVIAVRIADRVCVVHPRWMTVEQSNEVARQLTRLAPPEDSQQ